MESRSCDARELSDSLAPRRRGEGEGEGQPRPLAWPIPSPAALRGARRIPRTLASSRFRPRFKPFGALGSYRLIYEVTTERIFILGLLHDARDLVALWRRDKRTGETQP